MQNTQRTGNLLIGQKCGASVNSPPLSLCCTPVLQTLGGERRRHPPGPESRETTLNAVSPPSRGETATKPKINALLAEANAIVNLTWSVPQLARKKEFPLWSLNSVLFPKCCGSRCLIVQKKVKHMDNGRTERFWTVDRCRHGGPEALQMSRRAAHIWLRAPVTSTDEALGVCT